MEALRRFQLNALRAVEAAGRLGSLSKAAAELGVTTGAVSQHLRHVEQQLQASLFVRGPKGLRPTTIGERIVPDLTHGFRTIDDALALLCDNAKRGLVVTVAPVLAATWLVRRLPRFQSLRPDVQVRIDATIDTVDLDTSEADVAIRVGAGPWRGVRAERLIERTIFPVCSPAMAREVTSIGDLASVPIIRDHGSKALWSLWIGSQVDHNVVLGPGPTFSDSALCLGAAVSGQGMMMGWPVLVTDALRSGELVAPFPGRVATGTSYWLLTSSKMKPSAAVAAFGAWLKAEMTADRGDGGDHPPP